jgi:hypothetical protein
MLSSLRIALAVGAAIYFVTPCSWSEPTKSKPAGGAGPPVAAAVQPAAPVAVGTPSPAMIAAPSAEEQARTVLEKATKFHPWVNSLGMEFVPVTGTQVLFSIWDTRLRDFGMFVKSTGYDATGGMYSVGRYGWTQRGATWKKPGFIQGSTHPVVGVSWNDAKEFCKWLTKREQSAGDLPEGRAYRYRVSLCYSGRVFALGVLVLVWKAAGSFCNS